MEIDCELSRRAIPAPITSRTRPPQKEKRAAIVIGVLVAIVFVAAIIRGINPFAVLLGCALLTVAICWIVFPVIVLSKFNELLEIERKILRQMENQQREQQAKQ